MPKSAHPRTPQRARAKRMRKIGKTVRHRPGGFRLLQEGSSRTGLSVQLCRWNTGVRKAQKPRNRLSELRGRRRGARSRLGGRRVTCSGSCLEALAHHHEGASRPRAAWRGSWQQKAFQSLTGTKPTCGFRSTATITPRSYRREGNPSVERIQKFQLPGWRDIEAMERGKIPGTETKRLGPDRHDSRLVAPLGAAALLRAGLLPAASIRSLGSDGKMLLNGNLRQPTPIANTLSSHSTPHPQLIPSLTEGGDQCRKMVSRRSMCKPCARFVPSIPSPLEGKG